MVIDAFAFARFAACTSWRAPVHCLARLLPAVILLSLGYGVAQVANASILSSLPASGR
jgi:hypothetical protein